MGVTGANYLVGGRVVVDCGLRQGSQYADEMNYHPFPYDPKTIDVVLITHSHTDHVGRLPKLYRDGFRGKVYATEASVDLMAVSLPDNMHHIMREAEEQGRQPLFDERDLDGVMKLVHGVAYGATLDLGGGMNVRFHDAGHVLGSAIVEIRWDGSEGKGNIFFSGDLGNSPTPLLKTTEFIHDAKYVVVESAYGDRVHEDRAGRKDKLVKVITETMARGGVLMIPSFALERTQELLFELNDLLAKKKIPPVPVFIDSPLAIRLTEVYRKHVHDFNKQAIDLVQGGDDVFAFPGLRVTMTADESKRINNVPAPKIIIAGSGMSQGGRILHHEQRYLSDPNSTILFAGYQVDGSLGRTIQRGINDVVIFGERIPVRCHVETLSGYSAHADQPTLLNWVAQSNTKGSLKKVFVVQGEENAAKTLANLIRERVGVSAVAPHEGEGFELV